jgi:hypothetical protein
MTANDIVTVAMTETVTYEITLTHARLAEVLNVDAAAVPALLDDVDHWSPAGPIADHDGLLDEIDCDTYRAGSEDRAWSVRAVGPTNDSRAAAADHCERRARALIAQGLDEDTAIEQAADEAILFTRSLALLARQSSALVELIHAYNGVTYRLLRDLGDHLEASLAYVDRATIDAHLERSLSDVEWAAVNEHFTALDFDEHVGDHGSFRTDWIETVLDKAGVPGYGYTADGQPQHVEDDAQAPSTGGAAA